jgi:SpoIID/LytB domain protein
MGMAQWGAYGYALHGWSFSRILRHYYRGTTIGTGPSPTVRILLRDRAKRVTLVSAVPWQVTDGAGTKVALPAGKLVLSPALSVSGKELASPLTFDPGGAPLQLGKAPYRGSFVVISNGRRLQVVNAVGLEPYLQGVVGSEMPANWPEAALQAQAVAARSYALAQLETVVTANTFDLYADGRSQVYGGIDAETPSTVEAVTSTAHRIVLYHGRVATTYFSASSGGKTVSASEGIGTAIPYLVSVPDPYDTLSPFHDWGPVLVGAAEAGKELGLRAPVLDLTTSTGPSGHIESVVATDANGQAILSGAQVEADLGLRSSWFRFGFLALDAPDGAAPFGSPVTLTGSARGVAGVSLEGRTPTSDWQPVAPITPDGTGAFSVEVDPQANTEYRLAAGTVRASLVKVRVVPVVSATLDGRAVTGSLKPATDGATITLQRQGADGWTTVTTTTAAADGTFAFGTSLAAGTYRVRWSPGQGLSPGLSRPLVVAS